MIEAPNDRGGVEIHPDALKINVEDYPNKPLELNPEGKLTSNDYDALIYASISRQEKLYQLFKQEQLKGNGQISIEQILNGSNHTKIFDLLGMLRTPGIRSNLMTLQVITNMDSIKYLVTELEETSPFELVKFRARILLEHLSH